VGPPRTEKLPAGPDHEGEHPLEVTEFGRSAVGQTHGERSMMIPSPPGMVSVFSWSWNVMARPLLDPAIGNVLRSNEAKLTQLLRANVTSTFAPGSNQTPRSPSGVAESGAGNPHSEARTFVGFSTTVTDDEFTSSMRTGKSGSAPAAERAPEESLPSRESPNALRAKLPAKMRAIATTEKTNPNQGCRRARGYADRWVLFTIGKCTNPRCGERAIRLGWPSPCVLATVSAFPSGICGCSSEAEHQLPKLRTRVRFPSPARRKERRESGGAKRRLPSPARYG